MLWHMLSMTKASLWIDDALRLPVPYWSTTMQELWLKRRLSMQYSISQLEPGRYSSRFRIGRPTMQELWFNHRPAYAGLYPSLKPVATAPGSVLVDPNARTLAQRSFLGPRASRPH